ncbi:MAG TPA: phosphoribosyl-AMP cyclohydrolase [Actinomycetota bacterium]|nr:phosphoribosyl-AMP cyclohydrolase [Actinomycetota bacterium]
MGHVSRIAETVGALRFGPDGLLPAIAQQWDTGEVLMLAWMDAEAVRRTLSSGRGTYWSRSRGEYWTKGETSGNVQIVKQLRVDCDADAILLLVDQQGPACHTGLRSCFDTLSVDPGPA